MFHDPSKYGFKILLFWCIQIKVFNFIRFNSTLRFNSDDRYDR